MIDAISCQGNIGGTYDLGQGRYGERRGQNRIMFIMIDIYLMSLANY